MRIVNADVPEGRITLRIGINLGNVIVEDEDFSVMGSMPRTSTYATVS
jgi:class 3 adenylate cyclase